MYVKRNESGEIEQLSRETTADCKEFIEPNSPELLAFIGSDEAAQQAALRRSDLEFVRVLEDVIELLMDRGAISFTDLPSAAQEKLMARQSLRQRANCVELLDDDSVI
ncbi:tryptophan synthase subunit beta like protein [Halomonas sp. MCCC 1A11036]|uniref:Tryptophan synthase subunit beta like protein n=1 Tax=Billgrantia zhangzhouensis TaxID=2733481 RepID=A0ABS9AD40_9GAMM|nr:tryptophan synthase subunit beta like protein [Halomonas zhangzhouensis]MCE8018868.1 tryptophan synthase subunit beta like protein [Halomonas zhangzhouensis]